MECMYCGRHREWPCRNTRDMEDMAIDCDDAACFDALDRVGGGERGIDRVASLRQDRRDFLAAIESAAQKPMIPADMFPDPLLTNGGGYEEPHAA